MKGKSLFFVFLLAISVISLTTLSAMRPSPQEEVKTLGLGFPEEVTKILETSCFDCHTAGAKSEKALNKLNFSTWQENSVGKKIHKLDEITEEVKEGTMPPEKYLKYNPDSKLTKEQVDLIAKWAKMEGEKLLE